MRALTRKGLTFTLLEKSLYRTPEKTSKSGANFHHCTTLIVTALRDEFRSLFLKLGKAIFMDHPLCI